MQLRLNDSHLKRKAGERNNNNNNNNKNHHFSPSITYQNQTKHIVNDLFV